MLIRTQGKQMKNKTTKTKSRTIDYGHIRNTKKNSETLPKAHSEINEMFKKLEDKNKNTEG